MCLIPPTHEWEANFDVIAALRSIFWRGLLKLQYVTFLKMFLVEMCSKTYLNVDSSVTHDLDSTWQQC